MQRNRENLRYLILVIVSSSLLLSVTLVYPFVQDHDLYESMAWQLVHFHQLPYLGSWDMNWPGIVYIQSLSILTLGNSVTSFRLFDALMHIALFALLFTLLRRWLSARVAFWSVIIALSFFLFRNESNSGERDGYVAFVVLLAMLLVYWVKDKTSSRATRLWLINCAVIAIGILSGISIAIRPTAGLYAVTIAMALLMIPSNHKVLYFFLFAIGSAIPFAAILVPYLLTTGGIEQLYLSILRFNFDIYASGVNTIPYSKVFFIKPELLCNAILLAILLLVYFRRSSDKSIASTTLAAAPGARGISRYDLFLFIAYYLSTRLSIVVMGKYWRYHYELLLILSAVLLGILIEFAAEQFRNRIVRRYGLGIVAISLLLLLYPWVTARFLTEGIIDSNDPIGYARIKFAHYYHHEYLHQNALTQFVRHNTSAGDRIELVGIDPNLYWNVDLEPASRFTMLHPLVMHRSDGTFTSYQSEWRKEFVDSLISARPKFIIVSDSPSIGGNLLHKSPSLLVAEIPGFTQVISERYNLDTAIYYWKIYRRRDVM